MCVGAASEPTKMRGSRAIGGVLNGRLGFLLLGKMDGLPSKSEAMDGSSLCRPRSKQAILESAKQKAWMMPQSPCLVGSRESRRCARSLQKNEWRHKSKILFRALAPTTSSAVRSFCSVPRTTPPRSHPPSASSHHMYVIVSSRIISSHRLKTDKRGARAGGRPPSHAHRPSMKEQEGR